MGRSVCILGFIERPLVLGLLWQLFTGDSLALPLAVFFELFWLDLFPIGSYVPPMAAFPYLILLALSGLLGWGDSTTIAFPLALSLPFAYIIPYLEQRQRNYQKGAYNKLMRQARNKLAPTGKLAGSLLAASALQQLAAGLVFFWAACAAVYALFSLLVDKMIFPIILEVDWPVLFAIAAIGSFLSLRIKPALAVFFTGIAILAALTQLQ